MPTQEEYRKVIFNALYEAAYNFGALSVQQVRDRTGELIENKLVVNIWGVKICIVNIVTAESQTPHI